MTKEQFLELIKEPEIPIWIWFEYYRERGGILDDIARFEHLFSVAMLGEYIVQNQVGKLVQLKYSSSVKSIFNYYRLKFGLYEPEREETDGGGELFP